MATKVDEAAPLIPQQRKAPIPGKIRYTALLLSCFLAFGGYLVFDLCSALKVEITTKLHISNTSYSLFYVVYAWTNCLMVLFAGALIDNTTNRGCAVLFCTLAMIGQVILSFGVQFKLFWLMVVGRIVFGTGLGSICVAQNTISNAYFRDADLATAFAATLTVSRIGSVLNFFLSTYIYTWFGSSLPMVFWWGAMMTGVSVLAAALFFILDRWVEHKGLIVSAVRKSRKINWGDVVHFPPIYWVLCFVCSLYYICIFALMAVIVDYLKERDGIFPASSSSSLSSSSSSNGGYNHYYSIISATIYLTAIPCVPLFGRIVDRFGLRLVFLSISVFCMIPFNCYLLFTTWNPIIALVVAGCSYSMVASCLWPSLCMVVRDETVGTANGIATSIQMIGIGLSNLLVGVLRDHYSYKEVIIYFIACSTLAVILCIVANILDKKYHGSRLNTYAPLREKKLKEAQAYAEAPASAVTTTTAAPTSYQQEVTPDSTSEQAPLVINARE